MHEAIEVEVPIKLESRANARHHWRKRHAVTAFEREAVYWSLPHKRRGEIALPVVIVLTRIAPRRLDSDNLQAAFKAVRDQVAQFIGEDDRSDRLVWIYLQRRRNAREHAISIGIYWGAAHAEAVQAAATDAGSR